MGLSEKNEGLEERPVRPTGLVAGTPKSMGPDLPASRSKSGGSPGERPTRRRRGGRRGKQAFPLLVHPTPSYWMETSSRPASERSPHLPGPSHRRLGLQNTPSGVRHFPSPGAVLRFLSPSSTEKLDETL